MVPRHIKNFKEFESVYEQFAEDGGQTMSNWEFTDGRIVSVDVNDLKFLVDETIGTDLHKPIFVFGAAGKEHALIKACQSNNIKPHIVNLRRVKSGEELIQALEKIMTENPELLILDGLNACSKGIQAKTIVFAMNRSYGSVSCPPGVPIYLIGEDLLSISYEFPCIIFKYDPTFRIPEPINAYNKN